MTKEEILALTQSGKLPWRQTLRADATANWTAKNPILAENEFAVEWMTDGSKKYKLGDGVKAWRDLPYTLESGAGGSTIYVNNALQSRVNFTSDPQAQLNTKANIETLNMRTANYIMFVENLNQILNNEFDQIKYIINEWYNNTSGIELFEVNNFPLLAYGQKIYTCNGFGFSLEPNVSFIFFFEVCKLTIVYDNLGGEVLTISILPEKEISENRAVFIGDMLSPVNGTSQQVMINNIVTGESYESHSIVGSLCISLGDSSNVNYGFVAGKEPSLPDYYHVTSIGTLGGSGGSTVFSIGNAYEGKLFQVTGDFKFFYKGYTMGSTNVVAEYGPATDIDINIPERAADIYEYEFQPRSLITLLTLNLQGSLGTVTDVKYAKFIATSEGVSVYYVK